MTSLTCRDFLTACAVTTSALLLTACTSDSTDAKTSPSPTPTATATAKPTAASEKKLTEQVEAALAGFHNGDGDRGNCRHRPASER
ncbi:hypothetical protein AQJ84_24160 [Streptomyces resistomycificus]|uniref:Lipoprotein n=1 Tax=Streptomyces resistomycificus TaxID=67356 RepID=A0A0L8LG48_9ACTN|nr:hypothetical protein ADK37_12440 [Streptomyces resistomycificus]KUN95156.1 hypothetical protein AQJ84_24160 [Streptomyces resistomycificus]